VRVLALGLGKQREQRPVRAGLPCLGRSRRRAPLNYEIFRLIFIDELRLSHVSLALARKLGVTRFFVRLKKNIFLLYSQTVSPFGILPRVSSSFKSWFVVFFGSAAGFRSAVVVVIVVVVVVVVVVVDDG